MIVEGGSVAIPESETWRMVSATGDEYRVLIARPSGSPPPGGFPVIYLLDANATFGTVTEAVRLRARRPDVTGVVPCVVVGIAYPTQEPYDRRRRTFDFTAGPAADARLAARAGDASAPTGGGDAFRHWIEQQLIPRVDSAFPINPLRTALVGHSLGGYFAVRALLESPQIFRSYVAASPSLWWERDRLFDLADGFGKRLDEIAVPTRVLLTVGEYEEGLSPGEVGQEGASTVAERRDARAMVSNTRSLAERLAGLHHPRLTVAFEEFAGEDHASAVLRTINVLLRFVLSDRDGMNG